MKVNEISKTRVEVGFVIGRKELEDARLVALKRLAKTTKVPGFRSGRAPANVVEKAVDPNILATHTLENAVNKAVAKGFLDEDIRALDRPDVAVTKYVPGEMAEFTATAEILPKVVLGDIRKLKARAEKVSVSEKEVEEVIGDIRAGHAERKEVKRAAKKGDEVVIDFVGKKGGVAFAGGASDDHVLKLGSGAFIPGFEDGVVGKKAGEEFEVKLTFPKDYHASDLRGAKVVFEVKLKEVKELILPKMDAELAKKCGGFGSVAALRKDIRENLLRQKSHEAGERHKDALVKELVGVSDVAAPEVLVVDQERVIRRDMEQNLAHRGISFETYFEQIGKTEEEWVESELRPTAEGRVKAGLVLAELTKEFGVSVSDEEVAAKLAELRGAYAKRPEAVEHLGSEQARVDVRNRLVSEKVVGELVRRVGGR